MDAEYQYDLFVIGGGSGGLSAAKTAGKLGKKVALADFVKPSPIGTTWGLGGTCVNVGCIPKKLMHFAAQVGELRNDQREAGWIHVDNKSPHDWNVMVKNVQAHIKKLNWGYKVGLVQANVKYYNKLATFIDTHTLQLTDAKGKTENVTAKNILIAVGGRPTFPANIPGVEKLVLTSDDLFSLKKNPGKTLVIGASYVALECAGFLAGLGYDVTVMVRSILLRGFDQEIAEKIGDFMRRHHTKMIRGCVPDNIEATQDGRRLVTWTLDGQQYVDIYDTVFTAIGRTADTSKLNLESAGVKIDQSTSKILCTPDDRTSVPHIFAIGDCVLGRPELTPTAIMCGQYLAKRLFAGSNVLMDYQYVATTVFTPLEYGCVGYSEEDAIKYFGEDNILVYISIFKPLEWNFLDTHSGEDCYAKVIVQKSTDRVVGMHYLGPNAGEVIQGYAVAVKIGLTKEQLDSTVGIHPTTSEELTTLTAIKGIDDAKKEGC